MLYLNCTKIIKEPKNHTIILVISFHLKLQTGIFGMSIYLVLAVDGGEASPWVKTNLTTKVCTDIIEKKELNLLSAIIS
jgi:hypothetical protein